MLNVMRVMSGLGAIASLSLLVSCAPRSLVAAPSVDAEWIDRFTTQGNAGGVFVTARIDPTQPTRIDLTVRNTAPVALRISPRAFVIVAGQEVTGARWFPPLVIDTTLPDTVLAPGGSVAGFVHFEPILGDWPLVDLRASVVAATTGTLYTTVDLPLAQADRTPCNREGSSPLFPPCAPL